MALKIDGVSARTLRNNFVLAHLIDKAIGEGEFEWEFKSSPKFSDDAWHPSSDCVPGIKELWEKAQGLKPKEKFTADSYKNFMVGHFWHQYLQWIVEKRLELCKPEDVERKGVFGWDKAQLYGDHITNTYLPYHWVQGFADIAPCMDKYVVDFKTMREFDFRQIGLPQWCAGKYEAQINIYMNLFDLEEGLIICVQKDSPHALKEFRFVRNQPLIDAIIHKWKLVSACLDEGVMPDDEIIPLPFKGPV